MMLLRKNRCATRHHRRSGSLLLIVLVTVAILALSVLSFSSLMLVEEQAARAMTRRVQSKYLVGSGMEYTRLFLARPESEIVQNGGLWDNEETFRGVATVADINNPTRNAMIGRFTLVAPDLNDDGVPEGTRYGVVDESSKINVNVLPYYDFYGGEESTIGRDILLGLPEMTTDIADSILDFIDADDETREAGLESGHYSGLNPPYAAKNGPLDSIDELLLVAGVTPELLFGLDTNRNGVLDDSEASLGNVSLTDAESVLGWANYLTLYSKESNLTSDGLQRININADDLDQLFDDLRSTFNDDWANFIMRARVEGLPPIGTPPPDPEEATIVPASQVPFEIPADAESDPENRFFSVIQIMDTFISTTDADGNQVWLESPITSANASSSIPNAMQSLTVYEGESIPGRINIRHASRAVLSGIPGMDEELLESIISVREVDLNDPALTDRNRKYETFLLVEGLLGEEPLVAKQRMIELMPYICAGGDVYRAEILGYFGDARGTSRAEVVFDTTRPVPQILLWRDKSHLQSGYSVEALGSELEAVGGQLDR